MTRNMALKLARTRKQLHADAFQAVAKRKEDARKQWDRDHFEPTIIGQPRRDMSREEYERIIDRARANGQNVMFGGYDGLEPVPPPRAPGLINNVLNYLRI